MHYNESEELLVFQSGRTLYANDCVIGLGPALDVFEGYDGEVVKFDAPTGTSLTIQERLELANFMIRQWRRYRDQMKKKLNE